MLSLAKCRELIGSSTLDDEEVMALREQLTTMAGVLVDSYMRNRERGSFHQVASLLPAEERDYLDERAAIREFDGGLTSELAERAATLDLIKSQLH